VKKYLFFTLILSGLISFSGSGYGQRIRFSFPQVDWSEGWAVAFKTGTLGPGFEAIKSVNENWNARAGFSYLPFPVNRQVEQENMSISVQSKVRLGGINLQTDFFYHPWYYFTGGLMINLIRARLDLSLNENIQYGDITITPQDIGNMKVKVRPGWPVSPFIGIGVGNPLPKGRKFWFNIELGTMYQGKPRFNLEANGMIEPTANETNEKILRKNYKGLQFYPLFSAQVNYLIR